MGETTIPVDLTNPGQVVACLGLMEAAETLLSPGRCSGRFDYQQAETQTSFILRMEGADDPVAEIIRFLARAEAKALVARNSELSTKKWKVGIIECEDEVFPCPEPDSPASLPIVLTDGDKTISIDHWSDSRASGRDNVKFWAGSGGYPGAALARDALSLFAALGENVMPAAASDPFSVSAPQSSSFRFDWRRDYIPLDAGFSPNDHTSTMCMVGYPLVELLAAIGLQNARPHRPDPRNKLAYRYGVSNAELPTVFARAVLGAANLGFPMRIFRMRLGWPGQEGQARCIIDAQEEFAQ